MLLERDREQEGEEDLDPGQRDPQLLQQLAEVAVEAFVLGLVPSLTGWSAMRAVTI